MAYRQTELNQAKKAGTRARILKEARILVSEGGFSAAAVVPVAQRSGIATGTIYRHFPSKGELMAEVFSHASGIELEAVTAATQIDGSCRERLQRAVETFSIRAIKAQRLAYALIAEPADPLVEKERLAFRFAYAEAFEDLINDGINSGEFVPQDAAITSAALVGMLAESMVGPLAPTVGSYEEQIEDRVAVSEDVKDHLIKEITALALRTVGVNNTN